MTIPSEYELIFLEAGLEVLEDYLLSKELYYQLNARRPSGTPPYPRLTLGCLALSKEKARALVELPGEKIRLAKLDAAIETLRQKWKSAWEQKAEREYRARLLLWRDFLDEYGAQPLDHRDRYSYEVSRRVMLALIDGYCSMAVEEERGILRHLDEWLRGQFIRGPFQWDIQFAKIFPIQQHWYLWGAVR